jgi:outer membrane protein assembly factor BamD
MASGVVLLGLLLLHAGCGSSGETIVLTPEQRFEQAKALFDDGDYQEAINEFNVITLQYQGSAVAADAQFYMAESRFEREEYLLAAFEYGVLRRNYPASSRVGEAQYKIGLCYYSLSPRSSLDQKYTRRAIDEFQAFVEYNPSSEFALDAEAKIKELTGRLAKKQYEVARLYETMGYSRSALLSYDVVIEKFHDTEYAPLAYLDKADLLITREQWEEARVTIQAFLSKYPASEYRDAGLRLLDEVERELQSGTPTTDAHNQGSVPQSASPERAATGG